MKAGGEKKAVIVREEAGSPAESETTETTSTETAPTESDPSSKGSSEPDSPAKSLPQKASSSNPGEESSGGTSKAEKATLDPNPSTSQKKSSKKKSSKKKSAQAQAGKAEARAGPSNEFNIDAAIEYTRLHLAAMELKSGIGIKAYTGETEMETIMGLISKDLSEPYSIFTYRYFIHNWPNLCFTARVLETNEAVGAIICKLDERRRGYIAMLAVDEKQRRKGIGSRLVAMAIITMRNIGCDEVVLETEVSNTASLRLYHDLGFVRDKRLFRYYLNGGDAYRLKLWLLPPPDLPNDSFPFASFHLFQHFQHRAC